MTGLTRALRSFAVFLMRLEVFYIGVGADEVASST